MLPYQNLPIQVRVHVVVVPVVIVVVVFSLVELVVAVAVEESVEVEVVVAAKAAFLSPLGFIEDRWPVVLNEAGISTHQPCLPRSSYNHRHPAEHRVTVISPKKRTLS